MSLWISVLALLLTVADCQPGVDLPRPANLTLDMWDGEVTLVWNTPTGGPSRPHYRVEMAMYGDNWMLLSSCKRTSMTFCDLTDLIQDHTECYKVRVQMVTKDATSPWVSIKRFYPNQSQLQPPSFTLLATSTSVTVIIHRKPILQKIFLFGMTYTVYLQERGPENKTLVQQLRDGVEEEEDGMLKFVSLHSGREYCVSVRVEANSVASVSKASPQRCLLLPDHVWYIIARVSLSVLIVAGVLGILVLTVCCVLRRPEKTPAALISTKTGWLPLTVGEEHMEVVQDRGWFLSTPRPEAQSRGNQVIPAREPQEKERAEEDEDKRTSLDSGVSVQSEGRRRKEDSGFGSMGGAGSGANSRSGTGETPLQAGRGNCDAGQKEDSEVELGCQLGFSGSLEGEDCGLMPRMLHHAGDEYRSQTPSSVDLQASEESLKESPCETQTVLADVIAGYRPAGHCRTEAETVLADVIASYRSGHVTCVCLGEGQCTWCKTRGHYRLQEEHQTGAPCIPELGQLHTLLYTAETPGMDIMLPSYLKRTHVQMDTVVNMEDMAMMSFPLQPCIHLGESFPLLAALRLD